MSDAEGPLDVLDVRRIEGVPFVRQVEFHAVAESTNDLALRAARDPGLPVPALILAQRQTAGRGRGANRWWSGPGALTFSLVLEPARTDLASSDWPRLSLATAMAVCDVIEQVTPRADCGAKWPNDVQVGARKVCGILIEAPNYGGTRERRVVVGVGLNVNNSWTAAPKEIRGTATALCDVSGRHHDRTDLLVRLLNAFSVRLDQLSRGDTVLADDWQRRCVLRGRRVRVENDHATVTGLCRGIAADGTLIVATDSGTQHVPSGVVFR